MKSFLNLICFILALVLPLNMVVAIEMDVNEIKEVEKELDSINNHNPIILEEGFYELPVNLWHAIEDKASMGNKAMKHLANIEVKDKDVTLYIGSDKMTISNLTASLINLYYDDGEKFVKSTPHSFELEVSKEDEKRPEVFTLPLKYMDEYLRVMVDPKVEPMGDDPIEARLKFEFDKIKKISEDEAVLISKAKNGEKRKLFDPKESIKKSNKGVTIEADSGIFDKDFTFYANKMTGKDLKVVQSRFGDLDMVTSYELEALGELSEIPYNSSGKINNLREKFIPKGFVNITLPIKKGQKDFTLYAIEEEIQEIQYNLKDDEINFNYDKFVPFAMVEKAENTTGGQKKEITDTGSERNSTTKAILSTSVNGKSNPPKVNKINDTSKIEPQSRNFSPAKVKSENNKKDNLGNMQNIVDKDKQEDTLHLCENEIIKENKVIIIISLFGIVGIVFGSLYIIRKYLKVLLEEMEIKEELNRKEKII
ncbi:NEAT domain-containing protein [Anaerosphaera multitolerans]|uniref:Uncharacterized protein n=1 Tax=Anaerosphaera multitolerans TaxID=2487351 RepID=A0A437S600_9FIRM|nr:NEAT domain-containing protein [Anaerosphaera multitolerans]RVU54424.1 hypothetical protein EF514_07465 [Anaerosphaera multitolerans]